MDFAAVLAELSRFFEASGARWALAGAFALHAHGISRATADLDFVVEESVREDLLAFLDTLGYERLHASAERDSMSSKTPSADLDLRLRLTEADRRALRESSRPRRMTGPEYLEFLARFPASPEALRSKRGPRGPERFRL